MDPAVATLDFAKAGAIIADMIESYLAGGAPSSNPEGADHDDLQDCRSTSVATSLHLHSSVDDGPSPLQPGKYRAPVQSGEQGAGSRLEPAADPNPRSRPRSVRRANDQSRGLQANRTNCEVLAGPAREGLCLLQGVLICGICGRRLSVRYTGNGGLYPIYQCNWKHREALSRQACMNVAAKPLDAAVANRLVTAVTPLTIKLALEALTSLEERDKAIAAQWRRRIERARYDADLAERRYEAVDPGNRLIAGTLEQRWNDAMQRLLELEAELANFERQTLRTITAEQKQQILQLASDFPRLWTAQTTAARDRKRMLRLLIRDITVTKGREPKLLRLHIRWQGGAIETVELRLSPNRAEAVRYSDAFVAHIRALAATHDDDEIVALLNRDGLKSSTGRRFTVAMIRWIRYKHHIPSPPLPTDTFNVKQVRERYGVSMWVVYYWIDRGLITAQKRKLGLPYVITITDATDHRLRDWVANSSRIAVPSLNPN